MMNQIARHDYQTIRRLRCEVDELKEKLRQRDEDIAAMKASRTAGPSNAKAAKRIPWHEAEIDRLIQMWGDDVSTAQIAKTLGRTPTAINGRVHRLREQGVPLSRRRIGKHYLFKGVSE